MDRGLNKMLDHNFEDMGCQKVSYGFDDMLISQSYDIKHDIS